MEEAYLFSIRYFHHELDPSYGTSKGFLIYDLHLHCYRLQATHKILPVRNPGFLSTIYWPLVFNGKIAQKLCLPLKDSYILLILSILRIQDVERKELALLVELLYPHKLEPAQFFVSKTTCFVIKGHLKCKCFISFTHYMFSL